MNDDGTMSRVPDLIGFCQQHGLKMVTVAELIRYRMKHERYVRRVGEALLPTVKATFAWLPMNPTWTATRMWPWCAATSSTPAHR